MEIIENKEELDPKKIYVWVLIQCNYLNSHVKNSRIIIRASWCSVNYPSTNKNKEKETN